MSRGQIVTFEQNLKMPETRQIDTPSQADARRCFLIFPAKSTEHVTQLVAVLKGEVATIFHSCRYFIIDCCAGV